MQEALMIIINLIQDNIVSPLQYVISHSFFNTVLKMINNLLNNLFRFINIDNTFIPISSEAISGILGIVVFILFLSIFIKLILNMFKNVVQEIKKRRKYKK